MQKQMQILWRDRQAFSIKFYYVVFVIYSTTYFKNIDCNEIDKW